MKFKQAKFYNYMVIDISEKEEQGFKALIPKFPKLIVLADSPAELHQTVLAAIEEEIQHLKKAKKPVPKPDRQNYSGKFVLRIPPELHEHLSELSKASGLTLNGYLNQLIQKAV